MMTHDDDGDAPDGPIPVAVVNRNTAACDPGPRPSLLTSQMNPPVYFAASVLPAGGGSIVAPALNVPRVGGLLLYEPLIHCGNSGVPPLVGDCGAM